MWLAFSPFLAFLVLSHLAGVVPGLCAGAATAAALLVRGRLRGAREPALLELGTAILFAALAVAAATCPGISWSVGLVRLVVDLGLMLLLLAGAALGRPFAPGPARVTPGHAESRGAGRVDTAISIAWALAFGVLALADLLLVLWPGGPAIVPLALGGAALAGAWKFSRTRLGDEPALRGSR